MHTPKTNLVMNSSVLFRTETRIVEPESLPTNKHPTRFADLSVEDLIRNISVTSMPDDDLLESAILHPDERVAITAIERWQYMLGHYGRWQLYVRGLRTCEAEGIVWHPLFDAMSASACWPLEGIAPKGQADLFRHPEELLKPLISWLEAQKDPKQIEPLLRFKAWPVLNIVARHAGVITEELAERLPHPAVAGNPNLPSAIAELIASQAVDTLHPLDRSVSEHRQPKGGYISKETYAIETLKELARSKAPISAHLVEHLIEGLKKFNRTHCLHALHALGSTVSAEQIEAAFESAPEYLWDSLIQHPATSPDLLQRVLEKAKGNTLLRLRRALSRNAKALAIPKIRRRILQTTSDQILNQALETMAESDEKVFREVLQRIIDVAPDYVASVVSGHCGDWKWGKRVRQNHLNEVIEGITRTRSYPALVTLLHSSTTGDDPRIHDALAEHPKSSIDVLFKLIHRARGESFRRVFRRIVQSGTYRRIVEFLETLELLETLEKEPPAGLADLHPEDFAPLLQSPYHDIRLKAIVLLSQSQKAGIVRTNPEPREKARQHNA